MPKRKVIFKGKFLESGARLFEEIRSLKLIERHGRNFLKIEWAEFKSNGRIYKPLPTYIEVSLIKSIELKAGSLKEPYFEIRAFYIYEGLKTEYDYKTIKSKASAKKPAGKKSKK